MEWEGKSGEVELEAEGNERAKQKEEEFKENKKIPPRCHRLP